MPRLDRDRRTGLPVAAQHHHIHDYGRRLQVENATRQEPIATLEIQGHPDGRLRSIVVGYFLADDDAELTRLTRDPMSEWRR